MMNSGVALRKKPFGFLLNLELTLFSFQFALVPLYKNSIFHTLRWTGAVWPPGSCVVSKLLFAIILTVIALHVCKGLNWDYSGMHPAICQAKMGITSSLLMILLQQNFAKCTRDDNTMIKVWQQLISVHVYDMGPVVSKHFSMSCGPVLKHAAHSNGARVQIVQRKCILNFRKQEK